MRRPRSRPPDLATLWESALEHADIRPVPGVHRAGNEPVDTLAVRFKSPGDIRGALTGIHLPTVDGIGNAGGRAAPGERIAGNDQGVRRARGRLRTPDRRAASFSGNGGEPLRSCARAFGVFSVGAECPSEWCFPRKLPSVGHCATYGRVAGQDDCADAAAGPIQARFFPGCRLPDSRDRCRADQGHRSIPASTRRWAQFSSTMERPATTGPRQDIK